MKEPPAADAPRAITLTSSERAAGQLNHANLQRALEGLHQDGLLLLKQVVDIAHVDHLREVMSEETAEILKSNERGGIYNQGVQSNILQQMPLEREDCLFDDVYFNPYIIQIANAYLGTKPIWNFTTGNNALANTKGMRQPVHKDIMFEHPTCPFYFIANLPLTDFSPANGSTEFWLGSHAHTTSADQTARVEGNAGQRPGDPDCNVRPEVYERRREVQPPIQVVAEKGDMFIRDLRTFHAGMPNESDEDRIMVAVGYQAPWYPNWRQQLYLPHKHANFFMRHGGQPVEVRANMLEDKDLDQLWKNYDFNFRPSV
ncbi:hypothetical protein AAFC00_003828 [Neodothiora populina]